MQIDFFIVDLEYISARKTMALYGRTIDGKKICVLDPTFQFYFWVVPEEKEDTRKLLNYIKAIRISLPEKGLHYVSDATIEQKKFLGKPISAIKVVVNEYDAINEIKEDIKEFGKCKTYENDFPAYRRYLIDKQLTPLLLCTVEGEEVEDEIISDITIKAKNIVHKGETLLKQPKILGFDIEVYMDTNKGSPQEDKDPIVMVGFYGNDGFSKVITWKQFPKPKKYIEFVKDEGNLILQFKSVIKEYKPDYLVGYFSDGFDFPFIRARAAKYGIKLDLSLNRKEIKSARRGETFSTKITGIAHIDIYKFIHRMMRDTLDVASYSLDNVGKALLGEGKEDVDITGLAYAWDKGGEGLREYCEYNLTDAKLAYRLTQIMLPNLHEIVKLVGQPIYDVCRMTYGQLVEWFLIKEVKKFNELTPKRPYHPDIAVRRTQTYEGGFVYEPKAGLYKDIVVFDFRSLYPSVISAHNICPSTITNEETDSNKTPEIEINGETTNFYFTHKVEGFIPTILKDIIQRRNRVKEILNKDEKNDPVLNARQHTLKILANSFYGYLGFPSARWYNKSCAASIAAYARYYIKEIIEKAKEAGFKVIYSDTDSVFISLVDGKTTRDARIFLRDVNHELPSLIELEFQGFYPKGIFVAKKATEKGAKKKYALIDDKGKIEIKGFETIRGDWSVIAKEVQHKVFEIALKDDDAGKAREYVKTIIKRIKQKEIPLEKMVIQKQLKKDIRDYESIGPHVAVAKQMREKGIHVSSGTIIKYVIDEGNGPLKDKAKMPQDCSTYDAEYYINNQIIPAVEKIFEVLGFEKLIFMEKDQSQLSDF